MWVPWPTGWGGRVHIQDPCAVSEESRTCGTCFQGWVHNRPWWTATTTRPLLHDRSPRPEVFSLSDDPGPPGLHTTTRQLQTCTFERTGATNTTKIPRKTPREGRKERIFPAGEGKNGRNFGRSRGRAVQGKGGSGGTEHDQTKTLKPPHGNRETNTNTHKHSQTLTNTHKHSQTLTNTHKHSQTLTNTHKHSQTLTNTHKHKSKSVWPKSVWPKSVWPKSVWPKSVLAKNRWPNSVGQSRIGQSRP